MSPFESTFEDGKAGDGWRREILEHIVKRLPGVD